MINEYEIKNSIYDLVYSAVVPSLITADRIKYPNKSFEPPEREKWLRYTWLPVEESPFTTNYSQSLSAIMQIDIVSESGRENCEQDQQGLVLAIKTALQPYTQITAVGSSELNIERCEVNQSFTDKNFYITPISVTIKALS